MTGSFKDYVEENMGKFPQFLIYAVLEWVMIILLFIDGFLSFIANEYARFFELRNPCLLCTRIDHVLVNRNSGFYCNESICEVHKKDVSSLAYCHVHKKLSDIRNMCEGCLLSFATGKEIDCDRYKSLVGILHRDIDTLVDEGRNFMRSGRKDDPMQIDNPRCSCCGEPLKVRSYPKFSRNSSMNANIAPTPSPRAPLLSSWRNEEVRNLELPHIRYTELKFVPENDPELPGDEDSSCGDNHRRESIRAATMPLLADSEDISEEVCKTPMFGRNRFFGIPLSDSAQASPRYRAAVRKLAAIERTESFSEPIDSSALNEGDGDTNMNNFKRQVRVDQKSLLALYMELDEERSASAIAANNAMAMITRLQAEKAAVQMEALQYQRMMEEQAEYDQEALQVMKGLILKREEEIRVLESEIEVYREKYGTVKKIGSDVCEVDADEDYQGLKSQTVSEDSSTSAEDQGVANEHSFESSGELGGVHLDDSSLDFENERCYLLGMLTDIEVQLNMPSKEAFHPTDSDMVKHDEQENGNERNQALEREISLFRDRLRAVEADSSFLKHTAMTVQKGGEGIKLLTEIAQHLRKLRHLDKKAPECRDARSFA